MNIFVRVFTNSSPTVNWAMKVFLTKCANHFIKSPVFDRAMLGNSFEFPFIIFSIYMSGVFIACNVSQE